MLPEAGFQCILDSAALGKQEYPVDRRKFISQSASYAFLLTTPWASATRPFENNASLDPIPEPHFPDRLHLFVWRNWELGNVARLAQVVGTTPENILAIGASMGLPKKIEFTEDQRRRLYITVIRQNWHILPEDQLIDLLGWSHEQYEYVLKEDDFLWIKLGSVKPHCERLRYEAPLLEARRRAAEIKQTVRSSFGAFLDEPGELAFAFVAQLSAVQPSSDRVSCNGPSADEIDLSRGWTLLRPSESSGIPVSFVEEFEIYLRSAFACETNLADWGASGSLVMRVSLDPSLMRASGSFEVNAQAQEIRVVGRDLMGLRQALYHLQSEMEERQGPYIPKGAVRRTTRFDPRIVYSYFALYGDPLMEEEIDPFPEGLLDKLARVGVNGVWLQAVLRNLAPAKMFPEFGDGWKTRLRNLARLVERAKHFGIRVYLYLNEPRSMPAEFFASRPEMKGTHDTGAEKLYAMCTSSPKVRQWLSDSLAHVFEQVPELGGIFCITASENLTNCFSHGIAQFCPRCSKRQAAEVIAEVIQTFRNGVRRSSRDAEVVAWDWGWGEDWIRNSPPPEDVIERLPKDVSLLSVSEWDQPINRGGFPTKVGEYSISVVGPGPRAARNWNLARRRGLTTMAKVQLNNSWEMSAVPYIPVPNLIVEHCQNLLKVGVQGLMLSWTVGGYPSPNFEVAKEYYFSLPPEPNQALNRVAVRRYGKKAAPGILDAWQAFSEAFLEFPYGLGLYSIPTQHGPAHPLRFHRTGYRATMILFPYDDYKTWVGSYPIEVVEKQIKKMARLWQMGLESFRKALLLVPAHQLTNARKDLGIAETCYSHFESVANQIQFCRLRDRLASASPEDRATITADMIRIAEEETQLAIRQYAVSRADSRIAYEASNHYYYRPLDLVEKVLSCKEVVNQLKRRKKSRRDRTEG